MVACRYGISLRVLNSTCHSFAALHINARPCIILYIFHVMWKCTWNIYTFWFLYMCIYMYIYIYIYIYNYVWFFFFESIALKRECLKLKEKKFIVVYFKSPSSTNMSLWETIKKKQWKVVDFINFPHFSSEAIEE